MLDTFRKNQNLRVKDSSMGHGFGLYSSAKWRKPIKRFATIGEYMGRKTTQNRLDRRYGAKSIAQYSLCDGPDNCVDANLSTHGAPRYANDARASRHRNNSCFRFCNEKFSMQAIKSIKLGQEIFADYVRGYWPRGFFSKRGT